MAQTIDIDGYGKVEFPDGMSDDQIRGAIKRNIGMLISSTPMAQQKPFGEKREPVDQWVDPMSGATGRQAKELYTGVIEPFAKRGLQGVAEKQNIPTPDWSRRTADVLSSPEASEAIGVLGVPGIGTKVLPRFNAGPSPQFIKEQSDALYKLRQSITADKMEIRDRLTAMPPEFRTAEAQKKFYEYAEDPTVKLTPEEKSVFDAYLEPVRKEIQSDYAYLKNQKYPVEDPQWIHRVTIGKESDPGAFEALAGGQSDIPQYGTRSLPRTTSALQPRAFFVLEEPKTGHRVVVSGGKNDLTVWQQGKPQTAPFNDVLEPGQVVSAGGKQWTVKQATTKEIEAATPYRYRKSAAVNLADTWVRVRAVRRNVEHLENLTKTPEWQLFAAKQGEHTPRDWRASQIPQLHDWKIHPKLRAVFDDYYGNQSDLLEGLRKVNRFAVGSLFWQPTPHVENVWGHWFVARGWEWLKPNKGYESLFKNGTRAIREVTTQGKDYQDLLRNGSGLIYGGVANRKFYEAMAKNFGMDIDKNPERWNPIIQKLGFSKPADFIAAFYNSMNKALWWANDVFMLQRVYELEERGLSRAAAIKEAEKHIPNYRIPPEVLGSRAFSLLMQEPAVTAFGRYHYGVWNSYGNVVADLARGSAHERKEAVGNLMALGVLALGVYPLIDYGLYKLTGNEDIRKLRRGPAAIPDMFYKAATGERQWYDFIGNTITLAPVLKEGAQQMFNRDFFTGRAIEEPGEESPLLRGIQRFEHGAGTMVAPYNLMQRGQRDQDEGGVPRVVLEQIAGTEHKTDRTERGKRKAEKYLRRQAKRRRQHPQGPLESIYGGPQE